MLRLALFGDADSLNGEQRILRAAIAFFTDAALLAPEIALDRIALRHFVVTIALGEAHPRAVAEFADQGKDFPLHVGGWSFRGIIEENLVLDLQPAELLVEEIQFFINSHRGSPANSLALREAAGEVPGGHGWDGTKVSSSQPSAISRQPSAVSSAQSLQR